MLVLHTLGSIRLTRGDGTEVDEILRQPKRLALLAYLSAPRPGVWHRRDVLLAVFWSELDAPRARTALRNALYVLRQHLGDGVVRTRGDDDVSIDPEQLTSDVALMETDVANGRYEEAVERYGGDALPGLHIAAADGFESWLEEERARVKTLAKSAGIGLAVARERSSDFQGAANALTIVSKLDRIDESVIRRLMSLHDRAGDRAQALVAYDRFCTLLATEFDTEPAPETTQLADAIRARRSPERPAATTPPSRPSESSDSADPSRVATTQAPAAPLTASGVATTAQRTTPLQVFRRIAVPIVALLVAGVVTIASLTSGPTGPPRKLIVMPMENATGRAEAEYLATGIDEEIALRLQGIGGLETTISATRGDWPAAERNDVARIGHVFGVEVVFRGRLTAVGDSLVVTGDVIDVATGRARDIGRYAFVVASAQNVGSLVAAAIAGKLFRPALVEWPRGGSDRVDPESYRLTLLGWHTHFTRGGPLKSRELFLKATSLDPRNARAWAGLSSSWASVAITGGVPFDDGARQAEAAAETALALDSLEGSAWMNLAMVRGIRERSLRVAEPLFDKAITVDPGNPEIYQVKASLYRHAGQWKQARETSQIAAQMDPITRGKHFGEALVALCENNPEEALRIYRMGQRVAPDDPEVHRGISRALARLGQWDEAVAELRIWLSADSARRLVADTTAKGERAYWSLVHADGQRQLAASLERKRKGVWVDQTRLAEHLIASGDIDGGLDELEKAVIAGQFGPYRTRCVPGFDEVHLLPRYEQIMARLPQWKLPDTITRP